MRDLSLWRVSPVVSVFCLIASAAAPALAQTPAAPAPAPIAPAAAPPLAAPPPAPVGAAPTAPPPAPPPGYAYPPPPGYGYQQPYAVAYPSALRPPEVVNYDGGPVPAGYHVEERPRKALIITGALLTGVPWVLGITFAGGAKPSFENQTGWLVLPVLGPWLTLATRKTSDCTNTSSGSYCFNDGDEGAKRTLLVFDGLLQATGAVLFIAGIANPKKVVARDFVGKLQFTPAPIGRLGYGGFVTGEF